MWKQHSWLDWLQEGDRSTTFHQNVTHYCHKDHIALIDNNKQSLASHWDISSTFTIFSKTSYLIGNHVFTFLKASRNSLFPTCYMWLVPGWFGGFLLPIMIYQWWLLGHPGKSGDNALRSVHSFPSNGFATFLKETFPSRTSSRVKKSHHCFP